MDKLMDNHWFLKGISLLLALMLYMSINIGTEPETFTSSGFSFGDVTETISNVAVEAYYDQEKYVVTGIPEHINMTLEGQGSEIVSTKLKQQYEVYVNLDDYEPGTYDVRLQHTGISDELKVKLSPAKIRVTIQERIKKSFPVEVSFLNAAQIKEGYKANKAAVKPNAIEIYGTADQLQQVGAVRAYADLTDINQTFSKEVRVTIYDKSGNRMDLPTNPNLVTVTVPIISPEKTVPIKVTKQGSLPEGMTIEEITTDPGEVTVYGPKDVLDSIESIEGVIVDLDGITGDTAYEVDLALPKGAVKLSHTRIKVQVKIQKKVERPFTNLSLDVRGLGDAYELNFLDPKTGKIDVNAKGDEDVIGQLKENEVQPFINLQDLKPGTHEVAVQIDSPEGVSLEPIQQNVKIEIVEKS